MSLPKAASSSSTKNVVGGNRFRRIIVIGILELIAFFVIDMATTKSTGEALLSFVQIEEDRRLDLAETANDTTTMKIQNETTFVPNTKQEESIHIEHHHHTYDQVFGGEKQKESKNLRTTTKSARAEQHKLPPQSTWLLPPFEDFTPAVNDDILIPRIINKIYFQNDGQYQSIDRMVPQLKQAHKSWQIMNPGYDIRYFDLTMARHYLHEHFHPLFLRAFDCIEAFAIKSDFFRMTLLYREGGWHSDWKQECLKSGHLEKMANTTDFFAAMDDGNEYSRNHSCVWNGFLGARPQHAMIGKALEMMLLDVQSNNYREHWLEFGPCTFGRAIRAVEAQLQPTNSTKKFQEIAGSFRSGGTLQDSKGETFVKHKCKRCGDKQNWENGNSYYRLWTQQRYYCQDAPSIFHTTMTTVQQS